MSEITFIIINICFFGFGLFIGIIIPPYDEHSTTEKKIKITNKRTE